MQPKPMLISNKGNINAPVLKLGNIALENVTQHTHLGLTLNNNLTWNSHIESLCQRASKRVDILARLSYKLDRKSKMLGGYSALS